MGQRSGNQHPVRSRADLLVVIIGSVAIALWTYWTVPPDLALLVLLLPLLLLFPGYALIAVLFPHPPEVDARAETSGWPKGGIDIVERLALAFALSIALLPFVGFGLTATPWGITQTTVAGGMAAVTVLFAAIGIVRAARMDPARRYLVVDRARFARAADADSVSLAVSLTLVLSVLIAVGVFGFTMAMPQEGEGTTEVYILNPAGEGDPVAADYPDTIELGESIDIAFGLENHEREETSYTLVVQLEALDGNEVTEAEELAREDNTVAHGGEWSQTLELAPTFAGDNLRISFLVYEGDPPSTPDQSNAYRHVHLWIDVT